MNKKTIETLLNPIIIRIIIVMIEKGEVTTKDLLKELSIPQATLYRYMSKLEKHLIIEVVKKEYKRGSYEKTYKLLYDPINELGKVISEGTVEDIQNLFFMYMMNITNQFNHYIEHTDSDMVKDQTGFRTYPLYLTQSENKEFIKDFGSLLQKYITNKNNDQRMLYNFSFVHLKGE